MTDSNGSTAPKPPTELTVDEMLAIYPRAHVEAAIYDRNYKAGRNQILQRFKDLIAQGINVESCTAGIKDVEDTTPPSPPYDPAKPSNLHRDVLWRIIALKYTYRDGCEHDTAQSINLNAILDAYRSGDLKVVNETTVWFGGRLTMGPLPDSELKPADFIDKIPKWNKTYGPGRVWVEQPSKNRMQRLNAGMISPSNAQQHHVVAVGPVVLAEAAVIPQIGGHTPRTSGMFFREHLFTATSPFGNGNLYLSDCKSGVTKLLPAS